MVDEETRAKVDQLYHLLADLATVGIDVHPVDVELPGYPVATQVSDAAIAGLEAKGYTREEHETGFLPPAVRLLHPQWKRYTIVFTPFEDDERIDVLHLEPT